MKMGRIVFLSYLFLQVCGSNGFTMSEGFHVYKPSSMLLMNSDSDFYPLKENTITDLDLKLAEEINETSANDCLKMCRKRTWCLRAVHCKTRAMCKPGTFCLAKGTSTCYLAARSGKMLKPTGVCTFTKEEIPHKKSLDEGDMTSLIKQIPAKSNALPVGLQKGSENWNKKAKDTQSSEGIPTSKAVKTLREKKHQGGFQIKRKMPLKQQDSPPLMEVLGGVNIDIPVELSQNQTTLPDEKNDEKSDGSMNRESSKMNKSLDYPDDLILTELGQLVGAKDISGVNFIADFMSLVEQDAVTSSKRTKNFTNNVEITHENPILEMTKIDVSKEVAIPKTCKVEPTYVNQGAVRKRKFSRPGYPVVIQYECDQMGKDKYKYYSGPREALCDDQGKWTLPAMICIPISCYIKVAETKTALYGGDIHHDKVGRECQAWAEDKPHSHPGRHKLKDACPGCGAVDDTSNKCRDMGHELKPWCYTVDPGKRWEFCDIPVCKTQRRCASPPILYGAPPVRTELIGQKVHVTYRCHDDLKYIDGGNVSVCDMETGLWEWPELKCASDKCFYYNRNQWRKVVYLGNVSTTVSGRTCQRWDSQTPHYHYQTARLFPVGKSLSGVGNMCRDPDVEGAPWCYTTDSSTRWEFCPVPECNFHI